MHDDPGQGGGGPSERHLPERVLRRRQRSRGKLQPHGVAFRAAERRQRVQRVHRQSQQRIEFGVAEYHAQRRTQSQFELERTESEHRDAHRTAGRPY